MKTHYHPIFATPGTHFLCFFRPAKRLCSPWLPLELYRLNSSIFTTSVIRRGETLEVHGGCDPTFEDLFPSVSGRSVFELHLLVSAFALVEGIHFEQFIVLVIVFSSRYGSESVESGWKDGVFGVER